MHPQRPALLGPGESAARKVGLSDEGLLDRTHLRFFTLSGVQDLFARAGLQVFEIQPRWWPHAELDRFLQVMASVTSALAIDPKAFAIQTQAVQYIVRAVRGIDHCAGL